MNTDTEWPVPAGLELVVFDLDYTLWDAGGTWCDCLSPPFEKVEGKVVDRTGAVIRLYPDVPGIMDYLDDRGLPMALASRTSEPGWARELLGLLGVHDRFAFQEIYPTEKTRHFAALRKSTGHDYNAMIFFDDEHRNIVDCGPLGVNAVLVECGVSWSHVETAFDRM